MLPQVDEDSVVYSLATFKKVSKSRTTDTQPAGSIYTDVSALVLD